VIICTDRLLSNHVIMYMKFQVYFSGTYSKMQIIQYKMIV